PLSCAPCAQLDRVVRQKGLQMPDHAAIVTGASSGIGLAIARMLGEEGYGVTMTARRPEKLDGAVAGLAADGLEVHGVAAAGAEHKNALVVNTASIAGKRGEGWLSVYAAAKHGVVGWTQSMIKELSPHGIKSTALCPAFVDTPMTDFVKEHVAPEEMIRPEDIAESVRFLLDRKSVV